MKTVHETVWTNWKFASSKCWSEQEIDCSDLTLKSEVGYVRINWNTVGFPQRDLNDRSDFLLSISILLPRGEKREMQSLARCMGHVRTLCSATRGVSCKYVPSPATVRQPRTYAVWIRYE